MESESPAAAVFELFVAKMCVRVAKVKAAERVAGGGRRGGMGILGYNLFIGSPRGRTCRSSSAEQPPGWFASWPKEMESASLIVRRYRCAKSGRGPALAWAWGGTRGKLLVLENPLFGKHGG